MSPISLKSLASLAAFLSVSNAHMMMKTPIPMGKSTLNNSPLDGTGSDFPCKLRGDSTWDTSAGVNDFVQGGTYELSFTGSAVHGGGSCQVSLTTDQQPTKDSKWMVIKSIEGGCPADTAGNLPADPNGSGAATFQYTIPSSMPAGDYTIAWTWNNKIGNREMYMNCGRAVIGGAKKKRYAPTPKTSPFKRDNFPDMFIANIGNGCKVPDSQVVQYPNPGSDLQRGSSDTPLPPVGNCGVANAAAPSGGSSSPSASVSSSSAAPAVSTATVQPIPSSSAAPSVTGGIFATVTASASQASSSAAAPSVAASSAAPAPVVPTPAAPAPAATGTSSGSVTGTQSGACSNEGAWSCAPDGQSFQRCASGMWSAPMQMAAGTACTPGVSNTFSMNAVGHAGKRDLHSHMNRRRHSNNLS